GEIFFRFPFAFFHADVKRTGLPVFAFERRRDRKRKADSGERSAETRVRRRGQAERRGRPHARQRLACRQRLAAEGSFLALFAIAGKGNAACRLEFRATFLAGTDFGFGFCADDAETVRAVSSCFPL